MVQASSECAACMSKQPAPGTATLARWLQTLHRIFSEKFNGIFAPAYFERTARKRVFATVGFRCSGVICAVSKPVFLKQIINDKKRYQWLKETTLQAYDTRPLFCCPMLAI